MSITRASTIIRGPAIVVLGGVTFRTKENVVFTPETQTFDIPSSEMGIIDRRADQRMASVTFTPVGVVNAGVVAALWPHLAKLPGQSLFGATDAECTVQPVAGGSGVRLANATVTGMPDIDISATKTVIGEVTVRGILADGAAWGAESHWSLADFQAPSLSGLDPAAIPTSPGTVNWGSGFADIKTLEGVRISFDMQTQDESSDEDGIYDITLTNLSATATLTPVAGVDLSLLAARMGVFANQLRGMSLPRNDLSVTGRDTGSLAVTLFNAALATAPLTYGPTSRKLGELSFRGLRGTGNAVAAVTVV